MATFVCPIHADVQSDKPISCAKCGMKLVQRELGQSAPSSRTGKQQPTRER